MDTDRPLRVLGIILIVVLAGCTGGFGGGAEDGDTTGADGTSGANGDADGGAASAEWCPEGTAQSFANPESGEQVSMEIRGVVERDGREVCHAVWETNNNEGDVQKIEMFYTEDREYQKVIMYDANGNVVEEFEMDRSNN